MRLCRTCSAWECREDDAWCGYCGAPCAQIQVGVRPEVVHTGELAPRIHVEVQNRSVAALEVSLVEIPEWLRVSLQAGTRLGALTGQAVLGELTKTPWKPVQGAIVVHTAAGSGTGHVMAIDPTPRVDCETDGVQLWVTAEGNGNSSKVTIRPAQGMLRILNVRSTNPIVQVISHVSPGGELAGHEDGLIAEIALKPSASVRPSGDMNVVLDVSYKGPHGPETIHAQANIPVRLPPQLRWTGRYESATRRQAGRQKLEFQFCNQHPDRRDGGLQNGVLHIHRVELTAPGLPGVGIKRSTEMPMEISGGSQRAVEFELNLSSLHGRPAGFEKFNLRVETNLPNEEWDVEVRVEPMPQFTGVVAIDFGSSNSCCAVWTPGMTPALLPVDQDEATISPTVVRYLSLRAKPAEIEAGDRPKRLAAIDAKVAASTADRLKQRLGAADQQLSLRPEKDEEWVLRGAAEAAADYLGIVRELTEVAQGAFFRDFILTHPARCSLRQIRRLRAALAKAFGDNGSKIEFLQEPIAALIGFLLDQARNHRLQEYTVASFDIGGGTTDIALISVRHQSAGSGQVRVLPRILYCQGDRFGGEDLTGFLMNELAVRFQGYLAAHLGPECLLVGEGVPGSAELEIRRNKAEFRRVAETFKASLSEEDRGETEELDRIDLRVLDHGHSRTERVPFSEIDSPENGDKLSDKFLKYAFQEIRSRVKMLRLAADATGNPPQIIQLSGKTAYLDVAIDAVRSEFKDADIKLATNPKECVVTGACLLRSLRHGDVVLDLDIGTQRMTSTIGGFNLESPYFQPLLRMDEVIPDGGLEAELSNAWDGSETIVLWEDLVGTKPQIAYSDAARDLSRLSTWIPAERHKLPPGDTWTLHVSLRNFSLSVEARASNGDRVVFTPLEINGE